MELFVFDMQLNRLGVIDDFTSLNIERHYKKMSRLTMIVEGSKENIDLLQKGRILIKSDDLQRGYLIQTREYLDDNTSQLEIIAPSVNVLLAQRIVLGQQQFAGNIETVIKSFVQTNAISPTDTKRVIPNLVVATNSGINITATEATSNKQLDEYLYTLTNKHDMSWDILINHTTKKFSFTTWQGVDRSTEQLVNPHVIFSKEFDNVLRQNYAESDSDYKTTAIVAGDGEGADRTYVTTNNNFSGLERYELFVDARDLQSTYMNQNNEEITLSPAEYQSMLSERGKDKIAEYTKIATFESEIDTYSQFEYGVDYDLGDKVSIVNDDLGIVMHTRVVSAVQSYKRQGESLDIAFGDNIPTLLDKLKRAVK